VSWRDDVREIVDELPSRFRLEDVYRYVPRLHRLHPENRHIAEKVRQQLQVLRDEGVLNFVDAAGTYERVVTGGPVLIDELPYAPGDDATRAELAGLIGIDPNPLRRGMFRTTQGPYRQHLFLFHNEAENPYGDVVERDRIRYVGQGMTGDQELSSYNKYLANHLDLGFHVHLFVQPKDAPGTVRYEGEVVCEDTRRVWRPDEERSVLEFTLVPARRDEDDVLSTFGREIADILADDAPPSLEERVRRLTVGRQVVRDRAFRTLVLDAYQKLCAVCGDPLEASMETELQAAHIVPVTQQGPDKVPNGLSLCVRHHWAFDRGAFTLSDEYRVMPLVNDPHRELVADERIHLPRDRRDYPHVPFLRMHRETWRVAA
jgi:hypothetical protein